MIEVTVNGKSVTLPAPMTISELLGRLGFQQALVAVAVNREHVRRGDFATAIITPHTEVEVLAPMAGG